MVKITPRQWCGHYPVSNMGLDEGVEMAPFLRRKSAIVVARGIKKSILPKKVASDENEQSSLAIQ